MDGMESGSGTVAGQLNIEFYGYLFGFENLWLTESLRNMWIISAAMIVVAVLIRIGMSKWDPDNPTGVQNAVEAIIETFHNYVRSVMGDKYAYYGNWYFTVFFLILFSNLSGLVLLRNPTADITLTFAFSLTTFAIIHVSGIIRSKGNYFKGYLAPHPVMLPLNIIGEIAPAISLAMRLFGVVVGGLTVSVLVYNVAPWPARIGFPALIHGYFDLFSGVLHAFIFLTLSLVFIRNKLPE
ncbi:MAG: F0F1 ATP synthase subunit A [Defluviitaleaceae bacterium]|nr:F0F1 ATP synthase subunit A [Defluviitaleaceae bacterium]